jgi:hypothetical protein
VAADLGDNEVFVVALSKDELAEAFIEVAAEGDCSLCCLVRLGRLGEQ